MQIEKSLINDGFCVSKVSENFAFQLFIVSQTFIRKICHFLKNYINHEKFRLKLLKN